MRNTVRVIAKNKYGTRYCVSLFNISPYIYERAHAYARARERYRHTQLFWFPFASKQWTFMTKRLIFPHMKKILKFLQKLA